MSLELYNAYYLLTPSTTSNGQINKFVKNAKNWRKSFNKIKHIHGLKTQKTIYAISKVDKANNLAQRGRILITAISIFNPTYFDNNNLKSQCEPIQDKLYICDAYLLTWSFTINQTSCNIVSSHFSSIPYIVICHNMSKTLSSLLKLVILVII